MKKISSLKKVLTDPVFNEENFVEFSNIKVSQSTNKQFLSVSMDIFKRIDTDHIVVVDDKEENITESKLEHLKTLSGTYTKDIVNDLVSSKSKSKPSEVVGYFETNEFLYLEIAKEIIVNKAYLGLTTVDLEII